MSEKIFDIILLCIPICGAVITGFVIPYIKTKISAAQMDEIAKWSTLAVQAAETLFDAPKSGEEKREYVIQFIDKTFNSQKEVITKDQIRVLLEAALRQMNKA